MSSRLLRSLIALTVASLLGSALLQRYLGHVMDEPDGDFYVYFLEAGLVHDHPRANMYESALGGNAQLRAAPAGSELDRRARAAGLGSTELYLYPPLVADMLAPVSRLPAHRAAQLWRAVNLLLVAGSVLGLVWWLGLPVLSAEAGLVLFAVYAAWPIHETLALGQIAIVLMALWTVGILAYASGWVVLSAAAFAVAAWLKVTPVLLLPVFFLWNGRRERRWLVSFAAALGGIGLCLVAINGSENMLASGRVLLGMKDGVPALANKSLSSVVGWVYYGQPLTVYKARTLLAQPTPHALAVAAKVLSFGFYGLCLWLVWRSRRLAVSAAPQTRALLIGTFAFVLPLTSPVSWRNGYAAGLVLLVILWQHARYLPGTTLRRVLLLTVVTVTIGSLVFDLAARSFLPGVVQVLLASLWPLSCAWLCVDVLRGLPQTDAQLKARSGLTTG